MLYNVTSQFFMDCLYTYACNHPTMGHKFYSQFSGHMYVLLASFNLDVCFNYMVALMMAPYEYETFAKMKRN